MNDSDATSGHSGAFMWSSSYDGSTWAALDFSTAERNPDDLLAIKTINKIIYLMGEETTELWYNSGTETNPFKPQTTIGVGIKAPHSAQVWNDRLVWLGTNKYGHARVYVAAGAQQKEVSTASLEQEWNSFSDLTDATAFIYEQDGHTFYELTFPTGNHTYVYDLLEGKWHERSSYNGGAGGKYLVNNSAFFNDLTTVGSSSDGKLYAYDTDVYQDNGVQIVRQRDTQSIASPGYDKVRHRRVELEFAWGTGSADVSSTATSTVASALVDATAPFVVGDVGKSIYNTTDNTSTTIYAYVGTTQVTLTDDIMVSGEAYVLGVDPQVLLYWSDDQAATWKGPIYRNIGLSGNVYERIVINNVGSSRDRRYRIKASDNAQYVLMGGYADLDVSDDSKG